MPIASSGFVTVPDPESYNLKPNHNVISGSSNAYMVSVYHQLHCLKILHRSLIPVLSQKKRDTSQKSSFHLNHIEHCLDYLRQAVICAGDITLEPPDEHPEKGKSPLQGWGVSHTCRSWEYIEEWRRDHMAINP